MKLLFYIFSALFFAFCRPNPDNSKEVNAYFDKEIENRILTLEKLTGSEDSLQINVREIDKQINNFILLSKDVENLAASVNKANAYFEEVSLKFKINYSDFTKINTGMYVKEIASLLKQNELNLLNQLVFKINPSQAVPFTAQ